MKLITLNEHLLDIFEYLDMKMTTFLVEWSCTWQVLSNGLKIRSWASSSSILVDSIKQKSWLCKWFWQSLFNNLLFAEIPTVCTSCIFIHSSKDMNKPRPYYLISMTNDSKNMRNIVLRKMPKFRKYPPFECMSPNTSSPNGQCDTLLEIVVISVLIFNCP